MKIIDARAVELRLEKHKYNSSPILFKILYDKYFRSDLYEKIRKEEISDSLSDTSIRGLKFDLAYFDKVNDVLPENNQNFDELVYMNYHNFLHKEKIIFGKFAMFALGQYCLIYLLKKAKLENSKFIFLDNNRLIYNKLISVKMILFGVMKLNLICLSVGFTYFFANYLTEKYSIDLSTEENDIQNRHRRSHMLYSKLL